MMRGEDQTQQVIAHVAERIEGQHRTAPLLVAIDGVDTAGKSIFADHLADVLEATGTLHPIRCSVDGFHRPRAARYRRGKDSPEGFFYDCFDYPRLIRQVIEPVQKGAARLLPGDSDVRDRAATAADSCELTPRSAVILDGIFLHRDELDGYWDLSVFLEVDVATVLRRAVERDRELFGSEEEVLRRYRRRYIPGQRLYMERCNPQERADIRIDNNDPHRPVLLE